MPTASKPKQRKTAAGKPAARKTASSKTSTAASGKPRTQSKPAAAKTFHGHATVEAYRQAKDAAADKTAAAKRKHRRKQAKQDAQDFIRIARPVTTGNRALDAAAITAQQYGLTVQAEQHADHAHLVITNRTGTESVWMSASFDRSYSGRLCTGQHVRGGSIKPVRSLSKFLTIVTRMAAKKAA